MMLSEADPRKLKTAIGTLLILLGLLQAGLGLSDSDFVFVALGIALAFSGAGYLWAEVYREEP